MIDLRCIISGGQTGADRGSLLAAHDLGLRRGGMAPRGWRAEDGVIPVWFREGMMQIASEAYPIRTRANVEASGGTLILSFGPLSAETGSMLTAKIARSEGNPLLALQIEPAHNGWLRLSPVAEERVLHWLHDCRIATLNVAGPRESREPGLQAAVRTALNAILADELGFGGR